MRAGSHAPVPLSQVVRPTGFAAKTRGPRRPPRGTLARGPSRVPAAPAESAKCVGGLASRMDVVLALGFDLFFKPKLNAAAKEAGVEVRYATPAQAQDAAKGATRVVADVSAPGVEEAIAAIRRAHPALPLLACYPHVETRRADAVRALGGVAVTRGHFAQRLVDALAGKLA